MNEFLCHYNDLGCLIASFPVVPDEVHGRKGVIRRIFTEEILPMLEVDDVIKLELEEE